MLALGAAGVGATAVAGTAWTLRGTGNGPAREQSARTPAADSRTTPTPIPSPTPTGGQPAAGGTALLVSRGRFSFDTFDVVRSGEPSIAEIFGRTHQRLVEWASFVDGAIGPGIALSWEQPSETVWLFDLDPASTFRGLEIERPVTTLDVVMHLERARAAAHSGEMALSQRPWRYLRIARVEETGDGTVTIETDGADPFLLETLASPFASIPAPESIEAFGDRLHERLPDHLVGSGPFAFRGSGEGGSLRFERHVGAGAYLDGLTVWPGGGTAEAFVDGTIDEFIARDRRDAPVIRDATGPDVVETALFEETPVVSSLAVGSPPWDNRDLRLGLSAALNRGWLAEALFGGRAAPAALIPPSCAMPFVRDETDLEGFAGYRTDVATDGTDARARWLAGGGDSLGDIQLDLPAIFDPLYSASSVVAARLSEVLGNDVRVVADSYPNIAAKVADGFYGNGRAALWLGWGTAVESCDPSLNMLDTFHSGSATARATGFQSAAADALLARLKVEFDPGARAAIALELESELMEQAGGGVVSWVLQRSEHFARRHLRGPVRSPFPDAHFDALRWVESEAGAGEGDR